jgi:hypothetical protein
MTEQADPEGDQGQRDDQPDAAERAGHDGVQDVARPATQPPPLDGGDHEGEAEQGQPDAVATVGGIELTGAGADPAGDAADQVGDAEPAGLQEPADAVVDPDRQSLAARRAARRRPACGGLARRRAPPLRAGSGAR